nr:DUF1361 domain-containing protein [Enterococcus sp. ZJ1622]
MNTILAYLPVELSVWMKEIRGKLFFVPMTIVWLLFFPNNFYLFTDLFHLSLLSPYDPATMLISTQIENWYKLLLIILSVFPTTILGCESLLIVSRLIVERTGIGVYPGLVGSILLFLNSIGIYFGRFLRLNSLDVFTNSKETFQVFATVFNQIDGQSFNLILLIFFFSLLLVYMYQSIIRFSFVVGKENDNEYLSSRRQSSHQ